MKHPDKWRDTVDPFSLPYRSFVLEEIIGYPHAGNDVFQAKGLCGQCDKHCEVEVYIKAVRQDGADIRNEVETIRKLGWALAPQVIDYDDQAYSFIVTLAKRGERLSAIVKENHDCASLGYMHEYGRTLARIHDVQGEFEDVKERRFFRIPDRVYCEQEGLLFVYEYLIAHAPKQINRCFCHGDFHYANILWDAGHINAILDFELSGMGSREFDIAWAIILRPGQKFFNTREEIALFREGYESEGRCNWEYVRYYMALIYAYFYRIGREEPGYQTYVMKRLRKICLGNSNAET